MRRPSSHMRQIKPRPMPLAPLTAPQAPGKRRAYFTAEEAFRMPGVAQAAEFIIEMVQNGPKDNLDIIDAAKVHGVPENDIRRAAQKIKLAEQKYETSGLPRPGKARGRRWRTRWGLTEEICERTGLPSSAAEW